MIYACFKARSNSHRTFTGALILELQRKPEPVEGPLEFRKTVIIDYLIFHLTDYKNLKSYYISSANTITSF